MNKVILMGRVASFDPIFKAGDDDSKSFLSWGINVKRKFKPEGEKYYPTDLFKIKAFNGTANMIMKNFKKNDPIMVEGFLVPDDAYEKDGVTYKGGMTVQVDTVHFLERSYNSDEQQSSDNQSQSKPPINKNPLQGAKRPSWKK